VHPGHFVRWFFVKSFGQIIPHLPLRLNYAIADLIGMASRRRSQSRIIQSELQKLLGDDRTPEQLETVAAESIANSKKDLFEVWSFPRLTPRKMHRMAELEGREHLDAALRRGKGAVVGVSHFGSWKIVIPSLAFAGYPTHQIGLNPRFFIDPSRPPHHNLIMEIEYQCEKSLPAQFIYIGESIRPAFRALKNNEVVLDSFDGFMGTRKIELDFLRGRLVLSLGPLLIAAKSGAALLPAFAVRQKNNRHRVTIYPEIPLKGEDEASLRDAAMQYAHLLEDQVKRYPSHYGRIVYDRFRDPKR
jgi:KDO2-lipid IV(A) lauroyltransferase